MPPRTKAASPASPVPSLSRPPKIDQPEGANGASMYDRLVSPNPEDRKLFGDLMRNLFRSPTGDLLQATLITISQREIRNWMKLGHTAEYAGGYQAAIQETLDWLEGYIKDGIQIVEQEEKAAHADTAEAEAEQTPYTSHPPLV